MGARCRGAAPEAGSDGDHLDSALRSRPHLGEAQIRNASDLPIFDVRTFFHKIHRIDPAPGGGNWVPVGQMATPPDEIICVFPPHTDRVVAIPEDARKVLGDLNGRTYVASIEFTDAAGNHRERDPRGVLVPRT
jgi:hypothetical protein